ncbi:MAG: hypothetical protein H8E31_09060 [Planctomycetes bacterium]|nr:hypothetical protein [Planctomycetota bacterium]
MLLAASLSLAVVHLSGLKARSHELQVSVGAKETDLSASISTSSVNQSLEAAEVLLRGWREMAEHEARCTTVLADLAQAAGVTLISLRSLDPAELADQGILAYTHEVQGLGDQRQIAGFLDAVYSAEGMAAIDALKIEPEPGAGPASLRASLQVIWYAPKAATEVTTP